MKRLILLLIFAGAMLPSLWAQDEANRALELFKNRDYKGALILLEEAIASHPDWYFPIMMKGKCNFALRNYEEALRNFADSLTLEVPTQDVPAVKYDMARCNMAMKNFKDAIEIFSSLVSLVGDDQKFDLFYNRGQCETQIAKTAERKNDRDRAYSYYSKAIVSFTEAQKYDPRSDKYAVENAFQKAYSQYKIGYYDGSRQSLEKCLSYFEDVLKQDPRHKDAHKFLVETSFKISMKQGENYAQTTDYVERYLKLWPNDAKMLNKLGQALQGEKKYKEAIDVFKRYVAVEPNDGKGYFSLGSCQMADKRYDDALQSFQKARQLGEKENQNVYTFSSYCYTQKKIGCYKNDIPLYESAVDVLNQGLKAIPDNPSIKNVLRQNQENLKIFKDNMVTDEQNRKAVLDNIAGLDQNLANNRATLVKNKEMYIDQPTVELDQAIKEGERLIREAEEERKREIQELKKLYQDAKRCGGAEASQFFNEMVRILRENGEI